MGERWSTSEKECGGTYVSRAGVFDPVKGEESEKTADDGANNEEKYQCFASQLGIVSEENHGGALTGGWVDVRETDIGTLLNGTNPQRRSP